MEKENSKNFKESWSIAKIIIGLFFLIGLIIGGYLAYQKFFIGNNKIIDISGDYKKFPLRDIKGISTDTPPSIKNDVNAIITKVKDDISGLTPESISSSASKIQDIIEKLKVIQTKGGSPVNIACSLICNK